MADTAALEGVFGAGETRPVLTLTVHSGQVDAVREQLATRGTDEHVPAIEVQGDPGCDPQTCRLDSELGSIEATLDVQLARLARAWGLNAGSDSRSCEINAAEYLCDGRWW